METLILKITEKRIKKEKIAFTASIIREGGLAAFPTDTLYALGTNALLPEAVARIYELKRRSLSEPLPIFLPSKEELPQYVQEVPRFWEKLADKFWPGQLTLIFKKGSLIPDIVTAGRDKVGIRIPNSVIALFILQEAKVPIVGTSANFSGGMNPTKAVDVIREFYTKIELIIDGGPTQYGQESTILDLTTSPPKILRLGVISKREIEKVIGRVELNLKKRKKTLTFKSKIIVVRPTSIKKMSEIVRNLQKKGKNVAVIKTEENQEKFKGVKEFIYGRQSQPLTCVASIYETLNQTKDFDYVVIEGIKEEGIGISLMSFLKNIGQVV